MSATVKPGAPQGQDLQGSAASAALYVTRDTASSQASHSILDEDGRLSAASAATSLKYARAQDLPSFPSQGGVKLASAGAAASLANENQKSFEHWKPDPIPAANKAAMQAKDYKMNPLWQPELSAAGSKAALQAHSHTTSPDIWRASESEHGLSAAGQAHAARKPTKPITERDVSASDHRKALLAATGAMSGSRKRSGSAPVPPQANPSAGWALKAANSTQKTSNPRGDFASGDPGFDAARIQNMAKSNVSRQMYGSTPPVSIEVEEKKRQDMLRASAVAMAQKMYAIQQTHIDEAKSTRQSDSTTGARAARNRAMSDASTSQVPDNPGRGYENLQETATKLAQERLAKLHDEHAAYRQYYGQTTPQKTNRLSSIRGNRRRASSLNEADDSDEEQSRKIKSQMSIFQSKVAEVDSKKRQADRDALLVAAHKNVTAQMNKMDEKVFSDTGKSSPQQRELWERQARERAQRESDERMINVGRVNIGGGKYLDQADIDAIAKQRLQPTLDEITDKAEKQRARDEEIRLEQERLKQEQETEKQREAEIKKELKDSQAREKQEERARRNEEKRVQREEENAVKEKRQAEVAAEKERARLEREEKRKSGGKKPGFFSGVLGRTAGGTAAGTAAVGSTAAVAPGASTHSAHPTSNDTEHPELETGQPTSQIIEPDDSPGLEAKDRTTRQVEAADTVPPSYYPAVISHDEPTSDSKHDDEPLSPSKRDDEPTSPSKRDSRIKSLFGRFRGKSHSAEDDEPLKTTGDARPATPKAIEATKKSTEASRESGDTDIPRSDSMRDVALAGRRTRDSEETSDMYGDANEHQTPDSPVSPVKDTPAGDALATAHTAVTRGRSPSISSLSDSDEERPAAVSPASPTAPAAADDTRGKRGLRQRLLKKVKPAGGVGTALSNKLSKDKDTSSSAQDKDVVLGPAAAGTPHAGAKKAEGETGKKSQDTQEREEARDAFTEEVSLAPPPKLADARGESPRGSREISRFHEEL